ncbi:MAG TPA: LPS assembly lipoprotein LptE [Burkholderiaceae bacterium]|nr:LPS assembly lipoprotein LptE [Burkholderiaceae bacterium]
MKRRQFTQTLFTTLVASASLTALSGCGFKMRGSFNYPFKSIYTTFVVGSLLGSEFKRILGADSQVNLITDAANADKAQVVLEVLNDQREKVVVGMTAAGQVREFQLRVRLKFKLRTPDGREILPETELLIQRDISFTETAALAKENEEALLYRDMQSDMVQQLLRRLAAVKSI